MPDPVSTIEVEDVLASIRRLVSGQKDSVTPVEHAMPDGRLILTPELRVIDKPDIATFDTDIEAKVLSEPDQSEITQTDPQDSSYSPQKQQDHLKDGNDDVATPDDVADGDSIVQSTAHVIEDLTPKPPVFKATLIVDDEIIFEVGEEAHLLDSNTTPKVQTVSEASTPEQSVHLTEEIRAKIAAIEAAISKKNDPWDLDIAQDSSYSETQAPPLTWEDVEDHDTTSNAKPTLEEPEVSNDDTIDEQALHDIVSVVVREELQGALGERITRNVRKLVRREIHRALTERNL